MEVDKEPSSTQSAGSVTSETDHASKDEPPPVLEVDEQTRLWRTVGENPSDFTSWTSLLQKVEQKGDLLFAREVFNTFFKHYPYCYGYWKKLADFEKTHAGNDSAKQVFERGTESIALSVDIWMHYVKFTTTTESENKEGIRSLYERALAACGLDYRSSKLWDSYLSWEKANGSLANALAIYDRLLATPTQQLQQHFDNFKKFLEECSTVADVLSKEEYGEVCKEVGSKEGEELDEAVKEKVLERRSAVFEKTKLEVGKRAKFEDAIKRPYFHVKPLERAQLQTWRDYLDFEVAEGDKKRAVVLFERCVIACALYEEFWSKFARYAEAHSAELARSVYTRACTIHLQKKPNIHISWATFEEKQGNADKARDILQNIDSVAPGYVIVHQARVGLEHRLRRFTQVDELYRGFLEDSSLTSEAKNYFSWRYAKFSARVLGDHSKAVQVMRDAISRDQSSPVLYLQLLDLETSRYPPSESAVEAVFEEVQRSEMNAVSKAMFAQRRVLYLEEFAYDISKLVSAREELVKMRGQASNKRANEDAVDSNAEPAKRVKLDSSGGDQATPTSATTTTPVPSAPPTSVAMATQQPDAQQQWAAAYQQQWAGAYAYGQPGFNYQQYYSQYPQTYTQTSTK